MDVRERTCKKVGMDDIKRMIDSGNLDAMQILWEECQEMGMEVAWEVFQTVYLHAALHKQYHICEWLDTVYDTMDEALQRALLPMFSRARELLHRP
jgi:hypothetical protein